MKLGENYVTITSNNDEFIVIAAHYEETVMYPVFFNGMLTSMSLPGVHHRKNRTPKWVYNNIMYGPGQYNQKLMRKFFQKIIPEEFL